LLLFSSNTGDDIDFPDADCFPTTSDSPITNMLLQPFHYAFPLSDFHRTLIPRLLNQNLHSAHFLFQSPLCLFRALHLELHGALRRLGQPQLPLRLNVFALQPLKISRLSQRIGA
jgi:hypothetical protein